MNIKRLIRNIAFSPIVYALYGVGHTIRRTFKHSVWCAENLFRPYDWCMSNSHELQEYCECAGPWNF